MQVVFDAQGSFFTATRAERGHRFGNSRHLSPNWFADLFF
jgi:hypothetical protein